MANSITLANQFVPILDEVYKVASKTSVLDGNPQLVQEGANANELIIPMLSMQGLGNYSRNDGYVKGDVTLTNETTKCNFDRGRMFTVDTMDNMETAGIAFGRLSSEFIRTRVSPEIDAFRIATYSGQAGISKVAAGATIQDGASAIAALRVGMSKMTEDEVPEEDRYLFITPTIKGYIDDMDTTKSRELLKKFADIIEMPQSRFYTAILQKDGSKAGEEEGGYEKATAGKDVNFMIIHKASVIQFPKHIVPKIIEPSANQTSDGYKFGYRNVGIADSYKNKRAGIYLHHKA